MRPGRLDRILYVGPPDLAGRVDIFRIRTRNMAVEPALDLDALAALVRSFPRLKSTPSHNLCSVQTSGCSGAEITAICQEAALIAMREDINASLVRLRLSPLSPNLQSQENSIGPAGRVRHRGGGSQATDHTRDIAKV
jgi:SpoVK/Ycf46/Vps4 family AAA+-type ATPase